MVATILNHLRLYPKLDYPESGTDLANIRKPCSASENHATLDQYWKHGLQGSAHSSTRLEPTRPRKETQVFENVRAIFAPKQIAMAVSHCNLFRCKDGHLSMKLCAIGVCFSLLQYPGPLADNRGENALYGEHHGVLVTLFPSPNTEPRESHRHRVPVQLVYSYGQGRP
jgi:hypothetical protein